jgi:hypothetical protein
VTILGGTATTLHARAASGAPGKQYAFAEAVRVSWIDGVFEFSLSAERGKLVTTDRSRESTVPEILDAFLAQLVACA